MNHLFELYTLEVFVKGDPTTFACSHVVGKSLTVVGENIKVETPENSFSMYALAALLPILPAKQRSTAAADWISTDSEIACPDPNCGATFEIRRGEKTTFNHGDVTKVPMPEGEN